MKSIQIIGSLASLSLCMLSAFAQAEEKKHTVIYNYSCKAGEVAGLHFNGNDWAVARFKPQKDFYLILKSDDLGFEMTVKQQNYEHKCRTHSDMDPFTLALLGVASGNYSCADSYGFSIIFDKKLNRGGIAHLFGALEAEHTNRDDMVVYPFMCVSS